MRKLKNFHTTEEEADMRKLRNHVDHLMSRILTSVPLTGWITLSGYSMHRPMPPDSTQQARLYFTGTRLVARSIQWYTLSFMIGVLTLGAAPAFAQRIITTVAGNDARGFSGDGGPATSASLNSPTGLGVDAAGGLYIVDTGNQRVRKVSPDGVITTVAGNSASLSFNRYTGNCAVDRAGNLYIPDTENSRVLKVGTDGTITTIASVRWPYSVAVDAAGAVYIGGEDGAIVKVDAAGTYTIVAGGGSITNDVVDIVPALQTWLGVPAGVAVDAAGNIYLAESHNQRVRQVRPDGIMITLAGSGQPDYINTEGIVPGGFSGDGGPAQAAHLNFPWGVAVDNAGNIYIADSLNNRIRKVTAAGNDDHGTFTNPSPFLLFGPFESGTSAISVSGLAGTVSKVTATITIPGPHGAAPLPADLAFLLVGPNGQSSILMSGVSVNGITQPLTLTFDDAASSSLTNNLASGTYKPSPLRLVTFPAPAPSDPYGTTLSIFNGTSPNGEWKLYAVNFHSELDCGISGENCAGVGGWSLTVTTTPSTLNPIDVPQFFVRQQYLDFLSREPEQSGLDAWLRVLNDCPNGDAECRHQARLTTSAAFFGSPEFQLKGYLIFRFYKLAFNRLPSYDEISADMQSVSGQTPAEVYARKAAYANAFVQRPGFVNSFGALANADYVATLLNRYQLTSVTTPDPANPDSAQRVTLLPADLVAQLDSNRLTRAQVLRAVADSDEVFQLEYNQAFVAMQYYGYLRRTPEASGYQAWLNYLNAHPTDFREMVRGFMDSVEYRRRFGQP